MDNAIKLCCFSTLWMYGEDDAGKKEVSSTAHGSSTQPIASKKERMNKALQLVKHGMSINSAAKFTSIPISTLRFHCIKKGIKSTVCKKRKN